MKSFEGIFPPRDETRVSHIAGRFFTIWTTGKPSWESGTEQKEAWSFFLSCVSSILSFLICLQKR